MVTAWLRAPAVMTSLGSVVGGRCAQLSLMQSGSIDVQRVLSSTSRKYLDHWALFPAPFRPAIRSQLMLGYFVNSAI